MCRDCYKMPRKIPKLTPIVVSTLSTLKLQVAYTYGYNIPENLDWTEHSLAYERVNRTRDSIGLWCFLNSFYKQ